MARAFTPKVVTANDLLSGYSIYQTADNCWSRSLSDAELITDEALADVRLQHAASQGDKVVGVYLADAVAGENGPEPTHFREEFRRTGPSNYAYGNQNNSPQPRT